MRKRNEKGFTLIEVVVVVAVIAILAAVLTPYITKYIDDSKVAKARNEVQVIGGAMTNFYKDTGTWPNHNPATGAVVATVLLYTGTTTPAAAFFGAATGWTAAGAGWNSLDTHLVTNGHTYPATGDARWAGPYAITLPVDPWGRPYVINAANFTSLTTPPTPIWVLSAGPNGVINTSIATTAAATVTGGDDIGFRVR